MAKDYIPLVSCVVLSRRAKIICIRQLTMIYRQIYARSLMFQSLLFYLCIMWELETHIGKLDYLMGVNYIYVPTYMVETLGGLKGGRLLCTVNGAVSFQCGLMSLSEGAAYVTINKTRMKQLKLQTGDQVLVQFKKDESEYGMDLCEELQELLNQDLEGKERFDKLTPGMQRYIIYYVAQVKSPALRLNRALLLIGNLKQLPEGKESFRAMLGKE